MAEQRRRHRRKRGPAVNFLIGIVCGAISGGVTYHYSGSAGIAVTVGLIVMILGFLGFIAYIFVGMGD